MCLSAELQLEPLVGSQQAMLELGQELGSEQEESPQEVGFKQVLGQVKPEVQGCRVLKQLL